MSELVCPDCKCVVDEENCPYCGADTVLVS